ncbi:MAG TPA: OadG family protein [Firmicutes bacterium]|jgi:sodium pump decarboxylase gamma subunit|nr:OadG family protein [Bacillota bacterium]
MEPQISAWSLTILSMIMVFAVLWGLALLINFMKWLSVKKNDKEATAEASVEAALPPEAAPDIVAADTSVAPEIVVAITAALAAYLDQGANQLFVSSISRLSPGDNWATAGRFENISASSLIRRSL